MRNVSLMAVSLIFSSAAVAATGYTATLAEPLSADKALVVNNNMFRCSGTTCVLSSPASSSAGDLRTCRGLQRKVGALTSYVVDGKPFDADRLAKCNAPG